MAYTDSQELWIMATTPPADWPGYTLEEMSERIERMKEGYFFIVANRGDDFVICLTYRQVCPEPRREHCKAH